VGPGAGLDVVTKRKTLPCPCKDSNPGHPARILVTILTDLPSS